MLANRIAVALLAAAALPAASLPELRVEAVPAGSVLHLKNTSAQPLTAYTIELVDYPGSSFWLSTEDLGNPIPPGAEKRIPITSMTVGAAPEYVKVTAAVYQDGSSAGDPAKVGEIVATRKEKLAKIREVIQRLQKAESAGMANPAIVGDLKHWAESLQPQGKTARSTPNGRIQTAGALIVSSAVAKLEQKPLRNVIAEFQGFETLLSASK